MTQEASPTWYERFRNIIASEAQRGTVVDWDDEAAALCAAEVARFLSDETTLGQPSSLLRLRIKSNRDREVRWLLRALVDFTSPNDDNTTPLHLAVRTGNDLMVELLLEHFVFLAKGRLDNMLVKELKRSRFLSNDIYLVAHGQEIGQTALVQLDLFSNLTSPDQRPPKSLTNPRPEKGRFDRGGAENTRVRAQLREYVGVVETTTKQSAFDIAVERWQANRNAANREIVALLIRFGGAVANPAAIEFDTEFQKRFGKLGQAERFAATAPCATCERANATQLCSACSHTVYCNAACQRADWPRHEALCSYLRDAVHQQ